jgi:hypothetical protein
MEARMTENVHQSDRRSPVRDEDLERQERGFHQRGHTTYGDEWESRGVDLIPENPGEPQSLPPERIGTPDGMTVEDVEQRAEIARALGKEVFPADRGRLVEVATSNHAPDWVLERLRSLPQDGEFQNVQDIARTLGLGVETHRN